MLIISDNNSDDDDSNNNNAVTNNNYWSLRYLIFLFKIPMGKQFLLIYRQFGYVPWNRFASPGLGGPHNRTLWEGIKFFPLLGIESWILEGPAHSLVSDYTDLAQHLTCFTCSIVCLKRDGTRAETKFRLLRKRTSPFDSAGASAQSNAGSRVVRISVSNSGYTTFQGSVRVLATYSIHQFPFHFPSRASPCAIRFQMHSTTIPHPPSKW